MRITTALVALATSTALSAQPISVAPGQLQGLITAAKTPSEFVLQPGDHGVVTISKKADVKISGPREARLRSMNLANSQRVTLEGFTFYHVPDATTTNDTIVLRIYGSDTVRVSGLLMEGTPATHGIPIDAPRDTVNPGRSIIGLPVGRAMYVTFSKNVEITKNEIRGIGSGISAGKVDGLTITDNDIHDIRTTPINGGTLSNVLIARNRSWNSFPWQFGGTGDHGDQIHIFSAKGAEKARNIRILDNLHEQRDGAALLGIYVDDNNYLVGYENVVIAGNVLVNGDGQGIRLENVSGHVTNNLLLWSGKGEFRRQPRIGLHQASNNLVISGNRAMSIDNKDVLAQTNIVYENNDLRPTAEGEAAAAVAAWEARFRPKGEVPGLTCDQLQSALNNAVGGEVLSLKDDCGQITISRVYPKQVTVNAGGSSVAGLVVTGGNVRWRSGGLRAPSGVYGSGPAGYALTLRGASRARFEGVRFTDANRGAVLDGASNIVIQDSKFTGMGADGIIMSRSSDVSVLRNVFSENRPRPTECLLASGEIKYSVSSRDCLAQGGKWKDGDHADAVQMRNGMINVLIKDNVVTGKTQGLSQMDTTGDLPLKNVRIEFNSITTDNPHKATLTTCEDCWVRGNTVLRPEGSTWKALIHSGPARRCGNYEQDAKVQDAPCP